VGKGVFSGCVLVNILSSSVEWSVNYFYSIVVPLSWEHQPGKLIDFPWNLSIISCIYIQGWKIFPVVPSRHYFKVIGQVNSTSKSSSDADSCILFNLWFRGVFTLKRHQICENDVRKSLRPVKPLTFPRNVGLFSLVLFGQ
jgi:hypothetical protein